MYWRVLASLSPVNWVVAVKGCRDAVGSSLATSSRSCYAGREDVSTYLYPVSERGKKTFGPLSELDVRDIGGSPEGVWKGESEW